MFERFSGVQFVDGKNVGRMMDALWFAGILATSATKMLPYGVETDPGTAMRGLFGKEEPMKLMRGRWHLFGSIPVMATFHPSYLLRNQALSLKRQVWEDMLQVLERLGHPISERQKNYFLPK